MLATITRKAVSHFGRFRSDRRLQKFRSLVGGGLRPGQEQRLSRLNDEVGFSGKTILEIGGDLEGKVVRACLALGARHVTSINHDAAFETADLSDSARLRMDATSLDLPQDGFDFVIGFAVVEHIRGLEDALANIHRVTKPGGHVALHGGPLWYSKKGHHLIVDGPSGRKYRFDGSNGSVNPLEGWDHLTRDPAELTDILIERGCPPQDADAILEYIQGTDLINRYSSAHIKKCFYDSGFEVRRCSESTDREHGTETLALLEKRHGLPASEFLTSSIEFLMHKA